MLAPRSSLMFVRTIYSKSPKEIYAGVKESLLWTFKYKDRSDLAGTNLYEASVDKVDHRLWFEHFGLPDTFASWFLVTELHVWMCAQRAMDDGYKRRGLGVRNAMISSMWRDCETRVKKLGEISGKKRQEGLYKLADHFRLMMFIYDEGLNKDDQALACALWRGMFDKDPEFTDFRHLRTLTHYVRSNVDHLDKVPLLTFHEFDSFDWKPLEESIKVTAVKDSSLS